MGLTKKHFKAVGEILSGITDKDLKEFLINEFSNYFKSENPNFDYYKFKAFVLKED